MTFLLLILALAAALAASSVVLARHDGTGPARPPASHDDPTFRAPSDW